MKRGKKTTERPGATFPPGNPRHSTFVKQGRFEELDAYRGVAALLLVVFHAYQYSREGTEAATYVYEGTAWHTLFSGLRLSGWFLVISGFLIFLPFARAAIEGDRLPSVLGFAIRRAIRILPVYYAAILLVWTWRYYGSAEQWTDLLLHLTFTQVFSQKYIFWTIGTTWILALIIQGYVFVALIAPLAWRACIRLAAPRNRALLLSGLVTVLILLSAGYKWWAFCVADIPETNYPVYFGPLANLDNFAMGMLLAVAAATAYLHISRPLLYLLGMAGIGLMVATVAYGENEYVTLYFHALSSLAFTLVLAATILGSRSSPWVRILKLSPFRYLGLVSYGIFIWHEPILVELGKYNLLVNTTPDAFPRNAIALMFLSVATAALSYIIIERPAMNLRYLFTPEGRLVQRHSERGVGTGSVR